MFKNLKDEKKLKDDKFLKTFSENIDDKSKEELEAEKLERTFEIIKNRKLVKERIDALRKKLNDLNKARHNKASSSETSNNSETSSDSENNKDDENVINLNNMSFDDLLNNPNVTPKIAEKIGKYFLKMANKKRNKDRVNNGDDDDMNPNIKINIEHILDNDLATPEYFEELSKEFFKLANVTKSKNNEDDSESSEVDSGNNNGNNNNGNNNGNNNDYDKKTKVSNNSLKKVIGESKDLLEKIKKK